MRRITVSRWRDFIFEFPIFPLKFYGSGMRCIHVHADRNEVKLFLFLFSYLDIEVHVHLYSYRWNQTFSFPFILLGHGNGIVLTTVNTCIYTDVCWWMIYRESFLFSLSTENRFSKFFIYFRSRIRHVLVERDQTQWCKIYLQEKTRERFIFCHVQQHVQESPFVSIARWYDEVRQVQ